jgi:hypothetical protein
MKKVIQIIVAVIAIASSVAIGIWAKNNYLSSVTLVKIPVPKVDIEPYTLLTEAHFVLAEFPSALLEKGSAYALTEIELVGKMTTSKLANGLPVAKSLVSSPNDFRLASPDLQVLSIPVTPDMAVGGQVRIGEKVHLYRIVVAPKTQSSFNNQVDPTGRINEKEIVGLSEDNNVKVELIATVPIINVLGATGELLGAQDIENYAVGDVILPSNDSGQTQKAIAIILVAVPKDKVEDVLRLIGSSTKGGDLMWVTLAEMGEEVSQVDQEQPQGSVINNTPSKIPTFVPTPAENTYQP